MSIEVNILSPLESDAASLSGGSWVRPLANLQDMQPTNTARSTDASNASTVIVADALSSKPWNSLYLGHTNLTAAATVRIRADDVLGNLTTTPDLDTGSVSAWPSGGRPSDLQIAWFDVLKQFTPGGSYRYWRIDFDDDANPDGYVEIGRLIICTALVPAYGLSPGMDLDIATSDVRILTPYGHTLTEHRKRPRLWRLVFDAVSLDDAEDALHELVRLRGVAGDFAVCLEPTSANRLHRKLTLATLEETPRITQIAPFVFRTSLTVRELL